MSSDDGIEYHKTIQNHSSHGPALQQSSHHTSSHQQPLSLPSTQSSCSLVISTGIQHTHQQTQPNTNTIGRRKSSLSYQHQLHQATEVTTIAAAQHQHSNSDGSVISGSSNTVSNTNNVGGSNNNFASIASPSRYGSHNSEGYHHIGGRLSIHPIDRYDDAMVCCLPPPSPAPTSDRFIMGIPSPSSMVSGHHYVEQQIIQSSTTSTTQHKYATTSGTLHRTMSPNSRFRMSDRFRDASPKCDRFVAPTHFLANSTPLVSSDNYSYLSSTVHTPVKRYVPTPPPPTEIYSDIPQSSSSNSSGSGYHTNSNNSHLPHQQQQQNHVPPTMNTLPYRFRMKCCSGDQSICATASTGQQSSSSSSSHHDRATSADHYATPPRVRPLKCPAALLSPSCQSGNSNSSLSGNNNVCNGNNGTSNSNNCNIGTGNSCSSNGSSSSVMCSQNIPPLQISTQTGGGRQSRPSCMVNEYISRTPSVEYLGTAGGRVVTPVSVVSEPTPSTCLHCNTIRRTTGVHQTTQTTGPLSPVPQQQSIPLSSTSSMTGSNVPNDSITTDVNTASPTPSTNHIQISPTSPPIHQQAQSQQQQQQQQHSNDVPSCVSSQQQTMPPPSQSMSSHSSMAGRSLQHHHQQHQQHASASQSMNHSISHHHHTASTNSNTCNNAANIMNVTPQRSTLSSRQQIQQRYTRKQRLKEYVRREIAKFFGVDAQSEEEERIKWSERQKRLALRRFGPLKTENELNGMNGRSNVQQPQGDRPDILPAQTTDETHVNRLESENHNRVPIEKKASVPIMIFSGMSYIIQTLNKRQQRNYKQWSRSFAPAHVTAINGESPGDMCEGLQALQEDELFFDAPGNDLNTSNGCGTMPNGSQCGNQSLRISNGNIVEHPRQIYMGERIHGWRTSAASEQQRNVACNNGGGNGNHASAGGDLNTAGVQRIGYRGTRISSQLLDGVLDNSRRPIARKVKLFRAHELDDRNDHRPFFTYWINTVQILVLTLSLICYGLGPIGIGTEQKSGQVLVTSLSLQTVQHQEQRNVWIGPRSSDLVHLGAKFAACMRRDVKIMEVIAKTRRQERETACCIRNDDSGCVQSSQADCSVRGLWPTKSISTWKKWSPGESGPGGRISGSVCGLDPKYCDAPASIAPYEWPDDITKWPICRKTNSFSQRFRFKDHTAEHMVCEVIGHPCCTGVFGECRITTREYCDFVNGYFHEEASLCSQVSCLNNVCGMFPFLSSDVPDQFYRLFTSLCLHAGILHLAITVAFQHIFLADLERLIGPIRTAIVYIGSGLAGNLTSAILVPYKPEVGPLASIAGVISSLVVLLLLIHWKQLKKPHLALIKLIVLAGTLFGLGTLPWQQNFAGLIAGIFCGTLLTIALVPFVSITKYGRKTKINLIWTCMLFHLFMYTIMIVVFYIFPTEFTSLNFGDVLNSGVGSSMGSGGVGGNGYNHHHSEDILINGGNGLGGNTNGDSGNRGSTTTFNTNYGNQQQHRHRILSSNGNSIVSCDKGTCTTSSISGNNGGSSSGTNIVGSMSSSGSSAMINGGVPVSGILTVSNAINQRMAIA